MRRLGIILALGACTPQPGGSDSDTDSTSSGASSSSSEDSGVQTVTGWDMSTSDGGTTSTPSHAESSSNESGDTTTTTAPDDTSDTGHTDTTTTGISKECGNGVVEGDELCDDGNLDNTDNCTIQCKMPTCGDGLMHPDEACDDGNPDNDDACLDGCVAAFCGDGQVWTGMEACDDGNAIETDACLPDCRAAKCGDGEVWSGHEACDDGFNDNDYNGCKPGCLSKADTYCGDDEVQTIYEHCDGPTGMANVTCDMCLFDFGQITQMACNSTCSWGAQPGCGQDDADIFCKLRTGNASAKATSWKTAPPTDLGGFPCSDKNVYIDLNGVDPRKWLGPLPQFGVIKDVPYQATKIKSTHGISPVLQAVDLVCDG